MAATEVVARAAHLADVKTPMLFLQGDRDTLADLALLRPVVRRLGTRARLVVFPQADHSFHVPVRSGRTDAQVLGQVVEALVSWIAEVDWASMPDRHTPQVQA